jgi:deltex-like protein
MQSQGLQQLGDSFPVVALSNCKGVHLFHKECLVNQYASSGGKEGDFIKCAVCETTYGVRIGQMPDGEMKWRTTNVSCPGFENFNTIEMAYRFPDGRKEDGTAYTGTSRKGYIPNSPEGIILFKMFVLAFERRLPFMIGTSLTTGQTNTVVWAGIHHKSNVNGGPFGYPDPTYFSRVLEELKVRNIDYESVAHMTDVDPRNGSRKIKNGKLV